MKLIKQNVGVDISKQTFDATFAEMKENQDVLYKWYRKFDNSSDGIKKFSEWCNKLKNEDQELHITMEATGVYYESLAYRMKDKIGMVVHVVLPNNVKKYSESLNSTVKTDKVDSKLLSLFGVERKLRVFKPMSDIYIKLRKLSREKEQLVNERTMVMNQKHAETYSENPLKKTITRYNQRIKYLKKQILMVEIDIKSLVDKDEFLSSKVSKIETIPGIGFNTIVGVIAETGGFENITSIKQLTSYSGMDVMIKESGQWIGRSRISKKGNSHIRRLMYMPTLSLVRHSSTFKNNYERIIEGKEYKMKGIIAMQRKALGLIYTLWKNDAVYDENYIGK